MRKFSADYIYPVSSPPLEQGVVITDDDGIILAIEARERHDPASLQIYPGTLIPGFVNTHCHLELSHMKGMMDTGIGLLEFIKGVVTRRQALPETIEAAILQAEQDMVESGIVAVGDISNVADSFPVKSEGRLRYYTFVEVLDFLRHSGSEKAMNNALDVFHQVHPAPGSTASIVPHAPYTVSATLLDKIKSFNKPGGITVSVHNQETAAENEFFQSKTGDFLPFYAGFGNNLEEFEATGRNSIFYEMNGLHPQNRNLFVHNTFTTGEEIRAVQAWSPNVYWATCPNANLFIENRLPDYRIFLENNARVTLGTDSLASNWQLSILEEMKTIARYQSYVSFEMLLQWATLNGAQALGFDDTLGSLEPGKKPGILCLEGLEPGERLGMGARVRRVV
ncbi:MAG: amidohydrolase family protein [Saprospiraceae bacterium]|nr:amidohydrolase family protein [Saprospiraceae bacterium]